MNLARGWNRQADAERNPIFYDDETPLTAASCRWTGRSTTSCCRTRGSTRPRWRRRSSWREAWATCGRCGRTRWRLYKVRSPTPLADPPAVVTHFDAARGRLYMPRAGTVTVRIPGSPWLSLLDAEGEPVAPPASPGPEEAAVNLDGCLTEEARAGCRGRDAGRLDGAARDPAGDVPHRRPLQAARGTTCPRTRTTKRERTSGPAPSRSAPTRPAGRGQQSLVRERLALATHRQVPPLAATGAPSGHPG